MLYPFYLVHIVCEEQDLDFTEVVTSKEEALRRIKQYRYDLAAPISYTIEAVDTD